MNTLVRITEQTQQLPEHVQQEVLDFVELLRAKYARSAIQPNVPKSPSGSHAGQLEILNDFDAPLDQEIFKWTNPHGIDLTRPFIYFIIIKHQHHEFRYVGKASSASRLAAYAKNVRKILAGQTRTPLLKKDGSPQSPSNLRYRHVHLVLSIAQKQQWKIEHYPLENVDANLLNTREQELILEKKCNLNNGKTWNIADFDNLSSDFFQLLQR